MHAQQFVLDRYTRVILTALTVLASVLVVELWGRQPSALPPAAAQVPDSGLQRRQQLDEMKRTNELLATILDRLENRTFKVTIQDGAKPAKGGKQP